MFLLIMCLILKRRSDDEIDRRMINILTSRVGKEEEEKVSERMMEREEREKKEEREKIQTRNGFRCIQRGFHSMKDLNECSIHS